jgi:hypothetical protein
MFIWFNYLQKWAWKKWNIAASNVVSCHLLTTSHVYADSKEFLNRPPLRGIAPFHLSGLHHMITQPRTTRRSMPGLGLVISRLRRDSIRPGEGKQAAVGVALRLTLAQEGPGQGREKNSRPRGI